MDPSGAAVLRERLEQQRHWLLASAARDGRQPRSDPDVAALLDVIGNERFYQDDDGRFMKRLADGAWVRIELEPGTESSSG